MSWDQHPWRAAGRVLLATTLALAVTAPSSGASGRSVWQECVAGNGVSTNHSAADFRDALANPPADGAEYSDCEDQIRAAQAQARSGGSSNGSGSGGGGTGNTGGGGSTPSGGAGATPSTGGAGGSSPAVTAKDLEQALGAEGVNPAAPAAPQAVAPPPVTVAGDSFDLSEGRLPSLTGAFTLPLPLAASAVVVLASAALPFARFVVARFGGPATGSTPDS